MHQWQEAYAHQAKRTAEAGSDIEKERSSGQPYMRVTRHVAKRVATDRNGHPCREGGCLCAERRVVVNEDNNLRLSVVDCVPYRPQPIVLSPTPTIKTLVYLLIVFYP